VGYDRIKALLLVRVFIVQPTKKHPKVRLDIYNKTADGYRPSYKFYLNGELVDNS
jgi:hypothetical protein